MAPMARASPWLRCGRSTPDVRRNASRPPSRQAVGQLDGRDVAAAAQRFARGDRSEELAVAVLGIVAGEAPGGVIEQGLRLDESGVEGQRVDERLERGARGAPRAGAVDLAGDPGVVEIGGSHAGADLSGGGVQQHGGGIAQALRIPTVEEIADRLLDQMLLCEVEGGGRPSGSRDLHATGAAPGAGPRGGWRWAAGGIPRPVRSAARHGWRAGGS